MQTSHRVVVGDAGDCTLPENSVDLVVTSPPYPMVELWDEQFAGRSDAVAAALERNDGDAAFEAMHDLLDSVWAEVARVLVEGGIACVVVGDATRSLAERFRTYRNHARIADAFERLGLDPLPEILWRKPANSAAKFMGSGMVPPNAYVTLEHEHVLVFRNGDARAFEPGADRRYEAAYFWEERNRWFSDLWTEVRGEGQTLDAGEDARERSAAFPFAVPYRLVNMYSVYGDTVFDPFLGTGTTMLAAMVAGRDSVGYELDPAVADAVGDRLADIDMAAFSREVARGRLADHVDYVASADDPTDFGYEADRYGVPVRTKQEESIRLRVIEAVETTEDGYVVEHGDLAWDGGPRSEDDSRRGDGGR